ncbi:MAG: alpha-E domain-containing protein [Candidatus Limivivens sp.]|nr:alpha-E domain-containing protein [Candidatus Limivivens sp.]
MGIISLEKVDHLFWLGRYTERVFTTLRMFNQYFDLMIDKDVEAYKPYCEKLSIPDIYLDKDDFIERYLFDGENPDSLYSNLKRAYDNAIVMREELSSDVLAYIQLSLDVMAASQKATAPLLELQKVVDYLFAFWGSVDDYVDNEECRNIMKCGKYVERLDLYMRFESDFLHLEKEFSKLINRLNRVHIGYSIDKLARLTEIINKQDGWKEDSVEALALLGAVIEV